jgi:membrane protein YqaA with SNARE-associated domain
VAYIICFSLGIMVIKRAVDQLPSPKELSLQTDSKADILNLKIPRCLFILLFVADANAFRSKNRTVHACLSRCPVYFTLVHDLTPSALSSPSRVHNCRSFHELQSVHATLLLYKGHYYSQLVQLYVQVYLFMQIFTVPGCFFIIILLGSIMPLWPALLLNTALTTAGCSINFWASKYLLRDLVLRIFPDKVRQFQKMVLHQESHIFFYLLFLRSVPALPSWFINFASPLAQVPFLAFAASTALGFLPQV